jgi:murein L,D-transpeptidase YcbB/YkuD
LADYREIAADGGYTPVPDDGTLRKDDADPRVGTLVQRLAEGGWHNGAVALAQSGLPVFDAAVDTAVKAFQARHGLEADGVAGPATFLALNISAQARVDQVRVNMERARWIGDLPVERTVLVNIAGFEAMLVEEGKISWQTRVIVGKDYTETPVFSDEISYVEFNPTWTVPRSIIRNELAPKVIADPSYLDRNGYYLAYKDGTHLDAQSVDWSGVTPKSFPYWIVQKPGEKNALGRVKFMFPNKHSVYMHDTPQRQLFDRTVRSFSHGCIRTENPMTFAELLLGRQGWDRTRIDEAVASEKTIRVNLERKVPVTIMYWTVDTVGSELRFYPDIYGRDAKLLAALDAPMAVPGLN